MLLIVTVLLNDADDNANLFFALQV